jgi:hypothetical protein
MKSNIGIAHDSSGIVLLSHVSNMRMHSNHERKIDIGSWTEMRKMKKLRTERINYIRGA